MLLMTAQSSVIFPLPSLFQVEGRASSSSCHQAAAPNRTTSVIFFRPTRRPARLLDILRVTAFSLSESTDKKSLVRRGSGQELCIYFFTCHEPPGCLSCLPLDVHSLGTCLGSSPVQWWCKCFPQLPGSAEVVKTRIHKSTNTAVGDQS